MKKECDLQSEVRKEEEEEAVPEPNCCFMVFQSIINFIMCCVEVVEKIDQENWLSFGDE